MKVLNKKISIPTLNDGFYEASTNFDKAEMLNYQFQKCFSSSLPPLSLLIWMSYLFQMIMTLMSFSVQWKKFKFYQLR